MKSLKELYDERAKLVTDNRKLLEGATDGKLSQEQAEQWDARDKDIDKLSEEIEERKKVDDRKKLSAKYDEYESLPPHRQTDRNKPLGNENLHLQFGRHKLALRPGTALAERASEKYAEAFNEYLLGSGDPERLGLQVSKDTKGGYLAPVEMANRLIKFLDDNVAMRRLATVLPPIENAVSIGAPSYDSDTDDADWTAEIPASDIAEDDGMTFGKRELMPHLLTKLVKAGKKFLRVAAGIGSPEGFIADRLAYKFTSAEENGYLTGTGDQQPLGVFVASSNGVPTTRDTTCASTTAFTADEVIDTLYALKAQYQMRATWFVSRDFVKRARKLKTGTGEYLWGPGITGGQPDTIAGRPYIMSEYCPNTFTTGQYIAVVADWSFYWIIDSMGFEVQRLGELLALRNQVGFLGGKETDGMPVLAEAFSRMKLG